MCCIYSVGSVKVYTEKLLFNSQFLKWLIHYQMQGQSVLKKSSTHPKLYFFKNEKYCLRACDNTESITSNYYYGMDVPTLSSFLRGVKNRTYLLAMPVWRSAVDVWTCRSLNLHTHRQPMVVKVSLFQVAEAPKNM